MRRDRKPQTEPPSSIERRRGKAEPAQPSAAPSSRAKARTLQERLGNQATQALVGTARHAPGSGRPLSADVRRAIEPRLGQDFSDVRVHDGAEAARAASALGARAYTFGNDIVFAQGQYDPKGDALLVHELAHVVQQSSIAAGGGDALRMSDPGDSSERAVDATMHDALAFRSPALAIRAQLRAAAPPGPTIQRAVETWGGKFDTEKYRKSTDVGLEGVEIELHFEPNEKVDATRIAFVQTARSTEKGKPYALNPTVAARTTPGGVRIDRQKERASPLYGTDLPAKGASLRTATASLGNSKFGWRYVDDKGATHKKNAWMSDEPMLSTALTQASQKFESTVLAVTGVQAGTFYGSVSWGWYRDAGGAFHIRKLSLVSSDAPTATFAAATRLWNKTTTSTGAATIDLPIVPLRFINTDDTSLVTDPADAVKTEVAKLAKNTRVELTGRGTREKFNKGAPTKWFHTTVVDGVSVGKVGWVLSSRLAAKESK